MKYAKTQPHLAGKALRVGIGAGVHEDGVMDALVLGVEDWSFTSTEITDNKVLVMVVPTNIEQLKRLGDVMHQMARLLETGEKPDLPTEPM